MFQTRSHASGPLSHLLILDLADERGSFCSKLLADLGATVLKVKAAEADFSGISDEESFLYDNSKKSDVFVDLTTSEGMGALKSLLKQADVLIETFDFGNSEPVCFKSRNLRRLNPRLVRISITPYGRTGPAGNCLSLPGCQPFRTASLFAAVAALIRLTKRRITRKGSHADISIHEAVASMLEGEFTRRFDPDLPGIATPPDRRVFSLLRCLDGYIQIPILQCCDTLAELIGLAPDIKDLHEEPPLPQSLEIFEDAVERWTLNFTRSALVELGQAMGFPWASVDSIDETLQNPQLEARRFFSRVLLPNGKLTSPFPGLPYKFSAFAPALLQTPPASDPDAQDGIATARISRATPAETLGSPGTPKDCSDGMILSGMRVIDLTRMISGPYATRILADFGAEVLKIQSGKAATGAERNDSLPFAIWNRNKRSVSLDLNRPEARANFLKLVATSDVVVENFSPRVMANWGLDYEHLRLVKPGLIMVSISAMGHTGPWSNFVGFASNFHAFSGIQAAACGAQQLPPPDLGYPYADLIAGLYAALGALSALEFRAETGRGQHVDLSALEAICTLDARFSESQTAVRIPDLLNDPCLLARRFLVWLKHPVLGKVLSSRTPLWDRRRKPKWNASPLLGADDGHISVPEIGYDPSPE